ncbi:hypothetical protein [Desulfosarcina sp.]|uniref:hypothetical protein n=1 Tax=Desulfosarcina sp. TaxID=2027861 RepID=UPI00397086E7
MGKILQRIAAFVPKERARFFEDLISMLASEVETCFPDRATPGEQYDRAINRVKLLIKAKGQIHAYFKLNLRSDLEPEEQAKAAYVVEAGVGDVDFLKGIVAGLDNDQEIQRWISDIFSNVLRRVTSLSGMNSERRLGSRLGSPIE